MKKLIALALISAMAISMASCSNNSGNSSASNNTASTGGETSAASSEAKVGFSILPSVDASEDEVSFSATYAAVIVDSEGKITACQIDSTGFEPKFEDGSMSEVDLHSKYEKGDDYGMVAYGGAVAEWYQQADAFAEYCIGKTAADVRATALTDGKPSDADLSAGCTISVGDFIEVVAMAAENASAPASTSDKLGTALTTSDGSDEEGAEYDTDYCVVTVGSDGKVTSCLIDTLQGSVEIANGAFVADSAKYNSKKQLGDNYGMVASGVTTMEWYQQAEAFESCVVGKTADEVSGIALTDGKAADADLSAGCTIAISSILENTNKAIAAAK